MAHWTSYLATGRGSVALFASIDQDGDHLLSPQDLQSFFAAVEDSHINIPHACQALQERSSDHALNIAEFQSWLVAATQEAGTVCIQPAYEDSDYIGDRSFRYKQTASSSQPMKEAPSPDTPLQSHPYAWNESTMSQCLRRMQYAVRGEVVMKAEKLAEQGRKVLYTNIGNPHAVGQSPLTYYRQVLALCDLPPAVGIDHPHVTDLFPVDVVERAQEMHQIVGPCGTGAYTHSQGLVGIRNHVAQFIARRDGHPAYPGDIFLTNGASSGIEMILKGLIAHDTDAIMIPIPQYPIYSALIALLGGRKVGYELDEDLQWAVTREELEGQLAKAKSQGLHVKGLAMINPGNPTGQVMQRQDIEVLCSFCADHGIVLMADEVYQR
jgi:hypothetical protein